MRSPRRAFWLIGAWVAATAATAGVALAVVGLAGEQVSDDAVHPLSAAQVEALGVAATSTAPAVSSTAVPPTTETTTSTDPDVPSTTVPADSTTTTSTTVAATTTSTTAATTTTSAEAQVDSRHVTGGTVVVRWTASSVELVSATPDDGYRLEIEKRGPDSVEVEFEGNEVRSKYHAEVSGGELVVETSTEDDD